MERADRTMGDCHYSKKMGAYFDRQLSASEVREVESHLAVCRECSQQLRETRQLSTLLAAAAPQASSGPALARIRSRARRSERNELLPVARLLTGTASVLLMLAGALVAIDPETPSSPTVSTPAWVEAATTQDADLELLEEPEVVLTQWVVAGLSEGNGR